MSKDVEMISSDHTIQDAAKIMHKDNVSSIVAMKNNKPVGIITERDFVAMISHHYPPSTKISQIMTSPVIHVTPAESIFEASNIMVKKKIRKIPVFDAGKIVGIVSATDILRYFRFSLLEQSNHKCPLHYPCSNSNLVFFIPVFSQLVLSCHAVWNDFCQSYTLYCGHVQSKFLVFPLNLIFFH